MNRTLFTLLAGLLAPLAFSQPIASVDTGPQFKLFDYQGDWMRTTLIRTLNQPADWHDPVYNYFEGDLYERLEIFTKPSDQPVYSQLCIWQGQNETCEPWRPAADFTRPGVYYRRITPIAEWAPRYPDRPDRPRFDGHGALSMALIQWWVDDPSGETKRRVLRNNERAGVIAGSHEALGAVPPIAILRSLSARK